MWARFRCWLFRSSRALTQSLESRPRQWVDSSTATYITDPNSWQSHQRELVDGSIPALFEAVSETSTNYALVEFANF